jgi:tetratricopeptide (TPR) repeat protein
MEPKVSESTQQETSPEVSAPIFIGRHDELRLMQAAVQEAGAGQQRLVLLAGEAGIGKTRLAEELARYAKAQGARVVWGRCWEGGGAPAYWPWLQILRVLTEEHAGARVAASAGYGAAALRELLGELGKAERAREGGTATDTPLAEDAPAAQAGVQGGVQGETARFYLFDAVTTFLVRLAADRPLVLIFDDLHAADRPSLLMLRFLARERRDSRLLVIGTYRDTEAHRMGGIGELFTALAREGRLLHLDGLQRADVSAFIRSATGAEPSDSLVRLVYQTTEGNPFFLDEVVRLLDVQVLAGQGLGGDRALRIPHEVREMIRCRLAPLQPEVREVLSVAATIGREFDVTLLHLVCERPTQPLLDLLTDGVVHGVLTDVREHPGRFSFTHTLIRDTLYDDLPSARRVALHRRVGEALERLGDPDAYLPQLAHHFFHAVPAGDPKAAISYSLRAGRQALVRLAYEDALTHFERAAEVASTVTIDDALRCDLLLSMGEAQEKVGSLTAARATFERAAEAARNLEDPHRLALAALRCGWLQPPGGVADTQLDALLAEALDAVGDSDPAMRARLLGRRAMANYHTWPWQRREAMTAEAVAIARRLDDRGLLAYALNARCYALWGLEDVEERLDTADEIVRLAHEARNMELALQGHSWRILGLLERADIVAAAAEIETFTRLAGELREPALLGQAITFRAMRALLDGRLDDAERLAGEALHIAQRDRARDEREGEPADGSRTRLGPNAALSYTAQLFNIRTHQGRLRELEDTIRRRMRAYPLLPVLRCTLMYLLCEPEISPEVRVLFEQVAAKNFQDIPRDSEWLLAISQLAEVCTRLGDADRAALLYGLLRPYAGRHIVVAGGWVCRGAVNHYLGMLAATMGAHDEADEYFRSALDMHERLGAPIYAARTRTEWARALAGRNGADHLTTAQHLLEQALAAYRALGLDSPAEQVAARLAALGPRSSTPANAPAPPPVDAPHEATLTREGEYWTLAFEGRITRLRHSKGLRYLAELLAHPGMELHAIDLAAGGAGGSHDLGDAGAALDADAQRAYRRRIADLDEEIAEARRFGDIERAARSECERDFIQRELAASLGLAGRDRIAASHAERARLNVTRALRTTIQRIQAADPALARHLDATIRTGTFCSYTPDPRVPIEWRCHVG